MDQMDRSYDPEKEKQLGSRKDGSGKATGTVWPEPERGYT